MKRIPPSSPPLKSSSWNLILKRNARVKKTKAEVVEKNFVSTGRILTLQAPVLQNGQTHSNADELFECVWPFCGVGAFMHIVKKWPDKIYKSCGIHNARFLKYVWSFFSRRHERVEGRLTYEQKITVKIIFCSYNFISHFTSFVVFLLQ